MTKFEQLLDYIVNEEHEKANELFHEIVVEKSREIYENLIAEEEEEDVEEAADEDMDEAADEDMDEAADEDMDESGAYGNIDDEPGYYVVNDDGEAVSGPFDSEQEAYDAALKKGRMFDVKYKEADESMDLEDSYMMDGDDEMDDMGEPSGLEKTDDLEGDIAADEEDVEFNVRDAIEKLEAALAALGGEGGEGGDDMGDMGDEMPKEDEMMGVPAFEGRRMTREYREKVGNDWEKNSQKTQGQHAGAGTGEDISSPASTKSPIASGANKPGPGGVNAKSLIQSNVESQHNTGTSPNKVNNGVTPTSSEKYAKAEVNIDGKQSGVKTLNKVSQNSKSAGPVGSGTGDKAGQTSQGNQKSLLKGFTK